MHYWSLLFFLSSCSMSIINFYNFRNNITRLWRMNKTKVIRSFSSYLHLNKNSFFLEKKGREQKNTNKPGQVKTKANDLEPTISLIKWINKIDEMNMVQIPHMDFSRSVESLLRLLLQRFSDITGRFWYIFYIQPVLNCGAF